MANPALDFNANTKSPIKNTSDTEIRKNLGRFSVIEDGKRRALSAREIKKYIEKKIPFSGRKLNDSLRRDGVNEEARGKVLEFTGEVFGKQGQSGGKQAPLSYDKKIKHARFYVAHGGDKKEIEKYEKKEDITQAVKNSLKTFIEDEKKKNVRLNQRMGADQSGLSDTLTDRRNPNLIRENYKSSYNRILNKDINKDKTTYATSMLSGQIHNLGDFRGDSNAAANASSVVARDANMRGSKLISGPGGNNTKGLAGGFGVVRGGVSRPLGNNSARFSGGGTSFPISRKAA